MNNIDLITQAKLDEMAAHIKQMKLDREAFWRDLKLSGRIDGEVIRCTAELSILAEQFKLQSFVVRVDGVGVITEPRSYAEAAPLAAAFGGIIEPRIES